MGPKPKTSTVSQTPDSRRKVSVKAPRTQAETVQRLFKTLCTQIDHGHFVPARKTCEKILRLELTDTDALHTRLFLLLHTDQYTQALESIDGEERSFEKAYALYRLQREDEAIDIVDSLPESRGAQILQAQLKYRQGSYQDAIEIYNDLFDSGEPGSDEASDIQTNLEACQKHLDFITTGFTQAIDTLPQSITSTLESAAPPAAGTFTAAHATLVQDVVEVSPGKVHKVRLSRVPKGVVPGVGPPPDPERWLKKSERSNFGKNKRRGAGPGTGFGTQGSALDVAAPVSTPVPAAAPSKAGKNRKKK